MSTIDISHQYMQEKSDHQKSKYICFKNWQQYHALSITLRRENIDFHVIDALAAIEILHENSTAIVSILNKYLDALDFVIYDETSSPLLEVIRQLLENKIPKLYTRKNMGALFNINDHSKQSGLLDILIILDTLINEKSLDYRTFQCILTQAGYLQGKGIELVHAFVAMREATIPIIGNRQPLLEKVVFGGSVKHFPIILDKVQIPSAWTHAIVNALLTLNITADSHRDALLFDCIRYTLLFHDESALDNFHWNIHELQTLNTKQLLAMHCILQHMLSTNTDSSNLNNKGDIKSIAKIEMNQYTFDYMLQEHNRILTAQYANNITAIFNVMRSNNIPLPGNRLPLLQLSDNCIQNIKEFLLYNQERMELNYPHLQLTQAIFTVLCKYASFITLPKHAAIITCINIMDAANIPLTTFLLPDNFAALVQIGNNKLCHVTQILEVLHQYHALDTHTFKYVLYNHHTLNDKTKEIVCALHNIAVTIGPQRLIGIRQPLMNLSKEQLIRLNQHLQHKKPMTITTLKTAMKQIQQEEEIKNNNLAQSL